MTGTAPSPHIGQVRPASPADAAAIASVHVRSWLATYPHLPRTRRVGEDARWEALWSHRLEGTAGGQTVLVSTAGGLVTGFVYFGPSPDRDLDPHLTGQIHSIHVDPAVTRQGRGGILMAAAVEALVAAGFSVATLWVVADNQAARGFYERLGWQPDGARRREMLAVEGEEGDVVEVVRYRHSLEQRP